MVDSLKSTYECPAQIINLDLSSVFEEYGGVFEDIHIAEMFEAQMLYK